MQVIDEEGNCVSSERSLDGFACMDILANAPFRLAGAAGSNQSNRVVVAADIK